MYLQNVKILLKGKITVDVQENNDLFQENAKLYILSVNEHNYEKFFINLLKIDIKNIKYAFMDNI